jgi:L-amino acid N-acyltransferase YncA
MPARLSRRPCILAPGCDTDVVHLRLATPDDVPGIAEIYAPVVEHTAISFEAVPPTEHELARRLQDTMPQYPWIVAIHVADPGATHNEHAHVAHVAHVADPGATHNEHAHILGYAYGHRFAERAAYGWSVETSIYVRETARGQRIGTTLYETLLTLLASQGYQQAFAGIALPNPASVALHEAMGFEHVGTYRDVGYKFERWHDVGWWQRPLIDVTDGADGADAPRPRRPVPVDALDAALVERVLGTP